ncbi:MAG: plasmid recombination protein [Parascardovia denticolens]
MEFNVGMPVLKLKRGAAAKSNSNRRGNLRKILCEAGTERYSKTKTLDRGLSDTNAHLGPHSSGVEAYDAILEEVKGYEDEMRKTSYKGRGLRSDAVLAFSLIVKPEKEWIDAQTPEDRERFFKDSYETLCEIGILRDGDVRMRERHRDEGAEHEHIIAMSYNDKGELKGKDVVNLKMYKKLNRDYPKRMREKGWGVNELKAYDEEAVRNITDDEKKAYKEEHIARKASRRSFSPNEYMAMKDAEKANELRHAIEGENERLHEEVEDKYDHLEGLQAYMEDEKDRLNDEVNEMIGDLEDVQQQVADAREELADLEPERRMARREIEEAKRQADDLARQKAENDRRARLVAERAWQGLQRKREDVRNRARDISLRFGDLLDADEHKHDDESQYY